MTGGTVEDEPFASIDFLRNAWVLIPSRAADTHETILIEPLGNKWKTRFFCSCTKRSYECDHRRLLEELYLKHAAGHNPYHERFTKSIFWKLFEPLSRQSSIAIPSTSCKHNEAVGAVEFFDAKGQILISYSSMQSDRKRLIERLSDKGTPSRYRLMNKAVEFVYSDYEKAMHGSGSFTQRQLIEQCFWYRFAYHCFRESSADVQPELFPQPDGSRITLTIKTDVFSATLFIPSAAVHGILSALCALYPEKKRDWMIDGELELLFRIQESGNNDVSCSPCVKINENGKPSLFHISDAHIFNALVYLATCSRFVTMNFESLKLLAAGWGRSKEIPRNDFSKFLEENMAILSIGTTTLPQDGSAFDLFSNTEADDYKRIAEPEMITGIDHIDLRPVALTDTQCRIAISYVCGSHSISMKDLVETRRNRRRFLFAGDCIVDCSSPGVRKIVASSKSAGPDGVIELSRAAMLQFRGGALSTRFRGDKTLVRQVKELLEFKPASELPASGIYTGTLRDYQERGVAWLLFLYQNNFGGLLCDDMGLGKTHQVIACIANAKEHFKGHGRVLVVCPTTVLNHWLSLLERFAPAITRMVYHSKDRKDSFDETCDVVLTTYGILRNDIETLRLLPFTIAIFDEAQQIKNPETASYAAAGKVRANVKIGLTGTPIENSMDDLKTLFDLVLPGLLDSATVSEESLLEGTEAASRLKPLTAPFILRRLKKSVLTELPPKIEDRRICTLSADQLALYEFAVEKRARPLASQLQDESKPVPYMHIFSLLNYFKMVCNHPALAGNTPALFDKYESGKWDLFLELLGESLGSRQKVVVFTQYLGMVEIFKNYLERSNIGHSILTGATRDRAAPIKAFAEDEACRVFVASLKAGGTGIDLVAGSVVVHYDRWWNAAREDQATDRVHRIGQVRGVQVIKLITEHTIEERIDEMIEKKRQLADEALVEDAPDALKTFSREELYAMLTVR